MVPNDPEFSWLKILCYAAFAGIGGFMGHLLRTIDSSMPVKWLPAILQGISASFVGVLMYFTCQALNLSDQWTGVVVGLAGWLGANATVRILESIVFKKLGLSKPDVSTTTGATTNVTDPDPTE